MEYANPDAVTCIDRTFIITIEPCEITSFTSDALAPGEGDPDFLKDESFTIWTDFTIPYHKSIPTFTQVPNCEYDVFMLPTIEMQTGDTAAWITNGGTVV